MLWVVTGGIGSGKSVYAEQWARAHGREAIRLSCPAWPARSAWPEEEAEAEAEAANSFGSASWHSLPADSELAERLNRINLRSNPFRAGSRIIIVDSLSGWLRQEIEALRPPPLPASQPAALVPPERDARPLAELPEPLPPAEEIFRLRADKLEARLREVVDALLGFEGKRIVVTEEASAGLLRDPWEMWYVRQLAAANRSLAAACGGLTRMTAGIATELRSRRGNGGL